MVLEKMSSDWWWAEVNELIGYVPVNHLSENNPLEEVDRWQDDEYFSSYGTLVSGTIWHEATLWLT